MAVAPLTYLEQKWANASSDNNLLIDAASTSSNRKAVPDLNRESFKNVSTQGRLTLASLGRKLYSDSDIVRGTVNDSADLATNNLQGQFWGSDKAWGDEAEALLEEHDKICDVRGSPYNMRHWLRQIVISHYREGDLGTILVENEGGYPFLQTIAAHRIGEVRAAVVADLVIAEPNALIGVADARGEHVHQPRQIGRFLNVVDHIGRATLAAAAEYLVEQIEKSTLRKRSGTKY